MERASASYEMFVFVLTFCRTIFAKCIEWFAMIYDATGMTSIWIGIVALTAVFSILLLPLRRGADLTQGGIGTFVHSEVNRHKANEAARLKAEKARQRAQSKKGG